MEFIDPSWLQIDDDAATWTGDPGPLTVRNEDSSEDDDPLCLGKSAALGLSRTTTKKRKIESTNRWATPPSSQNHFPGLEQLGKFRFQGCFPELPCLSKKKADLEVDVKEVEYNENLVVGCLSLLISIQDELLILFFTHVHAIFPIVNEYEFTKKYHTWKHNNQLMASEDFILLLAVLFSAFAVGPVPK